MSVCFEGEQRELRSLYGKMKQLQERKKPLVENGFYYPTRWLGNLVTRLGADWHDVYCRGEWSYLELKKNHLYFFTETAWHPPFVLLKLIQKVYPSLTFYFSAKYSWRNLSTSSSVAYQGLPRWNCSTRGEKPAAVDVFRSVVILYPIYYILMAKIANYLQLIAIREQKYTLFNRNSW